MTRNVSYKECVCDICNRVEYVAMSAVLPKEWKYVQIGMNTYDVCPWCLTAIDMAIEDIKEKHRQE